MTVRDYARRQVLNQILEVKKPSIVKVGCLTDDEIRKLIKEAFGITNHIYSDRIVAIAEGNARLAMLAGKVAAETNSINSIQNATELYECYYANQIRTIVDSKSGIASAGIIAFFQVMRLDNLKCVQLLLLYYKKRPDLFYEIYSALAVHFGVDIDSERQEYFVQERVVEQLCKAIESNQTTNLLRLFIRVADQFLKLSFSRTEGGRHNSIMFYTVALASQETVLGYRKMLLQQLYKLYEQNQCRTEIEDFLRDYGTEYGKNEDYSIVKNELNLIEPFFALLSPERLYHCVIAKHIKEVSDRAEYVCYNTLEPFLNSKKYKIYSVLNQEPILLMDMPYDECENWHRKKVQNLVKEYKLCDFQYLFQVCTESMKTVDGDIWNLTRGIGYAINACVKNRKFRESHKIC